MQIVLSDEDLHKMPLNLRECLKAFVFGDSYGELVEALGNQGDGKRTDPLAIALDDATLDELYNGINEAGRKILQIFAEKDGAVQAGEFMEALGLEEPRQLTGPLGGITRKLRSMFGADVSLWSYDKIDQIYLLPESHVYFLKRCFGLVGEYEDMLKRDYEEYMKKQEEDEKRAKAKAFKTGDEAAIQEIYDGIRRQLMDTPPGLNEDGSQKEPRHELTEEEFELMYQYRCARERLEYNASTEADQKNIGTNQARYEELQTREWDRYSRENFPELTGEIYEIREKKEKARERHKTQIQKKFHETNDVS
jgi:hypothetical protein